jgi:hypothetical protein
VADGHQRFGLAKRLNDERGFEHSLDGFLFREADGWSAPEVRILAALKNIREGSGRRWTPPRCSATRRRR